MSGTAYTHIYRKLIIALSPTRGVLLLEVPRKESPGAGVRNREGVSGVRGNQ